MLRTFLVAAVLTQTNAAGDHGGEKEECSCAQFEKDHPFTIDCDNLDVIREATKTLESTTCKKATYEWGGAFATPSNDYTWVSQAATDSDSVPSKKEYADAEMKLVAFDVHKPDSEHLLELAETAKSLMDGDCPVKTVSCTPGDVACADKPSITPTASGVCITIKFPDSSTSLKDFHATVKTTGIANVAFFTAHVPMEFERDTHYFMSTDLTTDVEPAAKTDGEEYNCRFHKDSATPPVKVCAQAFYIIQAHHDYCLHDTLTRYEEELFHLWEGKCYGCKIVRKYQKNLNKCPIIDCTDTTVAELGYEHLNETCTKADVTYAFEWAASFDTPDNSYTWVSQAKKNDLTVASNYSWGDDDSMIVAAFSMDSNLKSELFGKKDAADALMSGTNCPEVTVSCTPGDVACADKPSITPTASGVCITIKFPDSSTSLKDFHATVKTTGIAHMAFFTAHVPIEFERDTHYFMSTDLTTDVEPVQTLGESGAHDHGRRLAAVVSMNDRRSPRRLANPGKCCDTTRQQGAWKQVVAYHDECDHSQLEPYIEIGFHDYEAACEDFFCNLIEDGIDQTVCPYSPPPPPSLPPTPPSPPVPAAPTKTETNNELGTGAIVGIAIAVATAVVALAFALMLILKEKSGKPMFTELSAASSGSKSSPA